MKKQHFSALFLSAFILGLTLPALAQNTIGVHAGVVFTNFEWKSDPNLKPSPLPGLYAGAQFEHTWNNTFGWAWGMELTQNKSESVYVYRDYDDGDPLEVRIQSNLQATYIEMPLLLQTKIGAGKFKIMLETGVSGGLVTQGKEGFGIRVQNMRSGEVGNLGYDGLGLQFFSANTYGHDELEEDNLPFLKFTADGRVGLGCAVDVGKGSFYLKGTYLHGIFDMKPDVVNTLPEHQDELYSRRLVLSAGFRLLL